MVDAYDLSSLRLVACGGAPATAELEAAVAARLGCLVAQGYGMTEAGPMIASPVIEPLRIRHGSVGLPMPGTEVELVEGEVWVRGPHLMSGYLGNAEATAATIDADGWLHTGDTGRFDDDGFLYLGDRIKELIKVKGFQVAPAELEGVLRTHPAVADAAVVGVPDDEAGERPVAFVVARGELDREELMAFVAVQVAPYKQLREVELVDALPRSPTGEAAAADAGASARLLGCACARPRRRRPCPRGPFSGCQPSSLADLVAGGDERGGSPGRRGSSLTGISRPVTRRAASITSRTVKPPPLPRL